VSGAGEGAGAVAPTRFRLPPIAVMIARRLGIGLFTLFIVSLVIFFGVELLPGDFAAAVLGQSGTPETVAALRSRLGLDLPAHIRYLTWLAGLLSGDLGTSLGGEVRIADVLGGRLFNTFFLAAYAAAIAVPLAVGLGIVAALYRGSLLDRAINILTLGAISFPEFFVAYVLVLIFAIDLGWFPSLSQVSASMPLGERLYQLFLPAVTLTLVTTAHMMRMTRAAIINLLSTPYIEMARLKGIAPWRVIVAHALPNALAPIISVVAVNIAYLIVGVVLVEVVFVYPGLGQLLVDSVSKRDLPVVQVASMIFAATYILLNLTADVMSIVTNPRLLHPR
jgi:peptide/nickel transport system permease protein